MLSILLKQLALGVLMFGPIGLVAQSIDIGPPDTSLCNGQSITLIANTTGVGTSPSFTSINVPSDDVHSQVINIGFDFEFFGNTYNQCVVSSNGYITFNLGTAGTGSPWAINAASPTPGVPDNAIMFPWQDINPGAGSGGTNSADCGDGTFVVDFVDIAMFSCTTLDFSMQVVLYEGTNIIDTYIANKPLCPTWNGGAAIHGLENANGTQSVIVPGRNFPTQWAVTDDAVRFTPDGAGGYTIDDAIPFNPIPVGTENYEWRDAAGNILGTNTTLTVSPTVPTWYYCSYQSACSAITVTDSILVTIGNVNITVEQENVQCFGQSNGSVTVDPVGSNFPVSIVLRDTDGNTVQSFTNVNSVRTFNGLPAGAYTAAVIDAVGCETTVPVTITQPPLLQISAGHLNIACTGDNNGKAWAFAAGGVPPLELEWSDALSQSTDTIFNLGPGPYRATFTDQNGCRVDTILVVEQPLPLNVQIALTPDTCFRKDGTIRAIAFGGTKPYEFIWSTITDSAAYTVVGDTNRVGKLPTGSYTLLLVDSNGCEFERTVNVPFIAPPKAGFSTISKPEEVVDPVVEFFNESLASETYEWHFGEGGISNVKHPKYVYDEPGNYLVMLIAYNEPQFGCADTAFRYIFVEPLFTFYVPNSFTPDGDGLNDEFKPVGENFDYESYNLKIYDRWGSLIWQTDNPERGWNGTHQQTLESVKNGVYLYIFTMKKFNAFEPKVVKGSVKLYRTR
jgi:gliding motility-associated-like protein